MDDEFVKLHTKTTWDFSSGREKHKVQEEAIQRSAELQQAEERLGIAQAKLVESESRHATLSEEVETFKAEQMGKTAKT